MVVIKASDKSVFEEAIFIVKEDAMDKGITRDEIIREAQKVANQYVASHRKKRKLFGLPGFVYALIGIALIAAAVVLQIVF